MSMSEHHFPSLGPAGFHRIAYTQWGDPGAGRVLICVPGLTRTGRDFDFLAAALQDRCRVVCVDLVGRGRSGWLANPAAYGMPVYLADMAALIARLGVDEVDWLGTSLGGLIGMVLAAQANSPIRRLVMNDIGAFIPKEALARIGSYVGKDPRFASLEEAERHLRDIHAPFGPLTDQQWRHLAHHGSREESPGVWRLHYDPGIAAPYREGFSSDIDMWPVWDLVRCPVLLVRGEASDILSKETAKAMQERGPATTLAEFAGIGHAPAFMDETQIATVRDWLFRSGTG